MTFVSPDPIASGKPYLIEGVADRAPHELDDFVGETAFTVTVAGGSRRVCGVGRNEGGTVRFHEKDSGQTTKDVRVWQISGTGDGFVAASTGTF